MTDTRELITENNSLAPPRFKATVFAVIILCSIITATGVARLLGVPGSIWIALAAYPVLVGFFIALKRLLSPISNTFDSAVLWSIDIVAGLIVGVFIVCTEDASFLGWNIVRIFCVSICLSAYFNQRVSLYR